MMRTILVPLAEALAGEPALDTALSLAGRLNSHIRAVFVRPDPTAVLSYLPDAVATTVTREAIEHEGRRAAAAARTRFEAWRSGHGVAAEPAGNRLDTCFASWAEQQGEIDAVVTRLGRISDLVVLHRFAPDDIQAQRCFDAALFGTGRPTLLAPDTSPFDILDHVLIAWNGSREASHAVFGALPLLDAARRVSIFSMPEPGNDGTTGAELAEALAWRGIQAHDASPPNPPGPLGAALLGSAKAFEVTLIVMGGYTHSRLRQSFLGGVTRHVLAEAAIPVVMSH